ncbi:unnamed protein product [Plasmodium vivax]|uniref:(malaria parasite P. vivax) hypothetical protein n=1 Tax=Plasmodium vivax TaxID=5855 RepID=A0A8S4HCN8_PLAVI|nr:unnamed protein product [Plasmodium vivax]
MQGINDKEPLPHKFYDRLDTRQVTSILDSLKSISAYKTLIKYEESRLILAMLARNLKLIITHYPENREKRCRDVNHWINKELSKHESKEKISDYVLAIFNDIKWPTVIDEKVCEKKEDPYSSENPKLMKELDDYCEIRDTNGCNVLKNKNQCLKFNSYISGKKEYFFSKIKDICRTPDCKKNNYTIDDNCSLDNMDDTFREINCDVLYKKLESQEPAPIIKERSPLEIGFFIIVSFILFYLFILFLEKFTPVGSIIHRFKRRKYDLKRNIEKEDDDRYTLYHSDTMPSDSENKRYYIEYGRPHN